MSKNLEATQTAAGWDVFNADDEFIGFVLDGELAELELSGYSIKRRPFIGFGRLIQNPPSIHFL
jgi:hypothetical protein